MPEIRVPKYAPLNGATWKATVGKTVSALRTTNTLVALVPVNMSLTLVIRSRLPAGTAGKSASQEFVKVQTGARSCAYGTRAGSSTLRTSAGRVCAVAAVAESAAIRPMANWACQREVKARFLFVNV